MNEKLIFNPDLPKQAEEVIFSGKTNKVSHPTTTTTTSTTTTTTTTTTATATTTTKF